MLTTKAQSTRLNDLAYGPGERNVLDLHIPAGAEAPPLLLFIHGGAWFRGDKSQVEDYGQLESLLDAGFAVATMNYTYSQQAHWPAQHDDVIQAIRFLQTGPECHRYNMGRFAVWGHSSGAHLALVSAILQANDPSFGIDVVVSWFGPSNLHLLWQDRANDAVEGGNSGDTETQPESNLLGVDAVENPAAADQASPEVAARSLSGASLPPILLVHGTEDPRVSPKQTQRMFETLTARGAEVDLIYVEGGGHGHEGFEKVVKPSIDFIRTHLSR